VASELVLIKYPHEHVGNTPDYHEWVQAERVRANARGRLNPRMWFRTWTKWVCNNPDCTAMAIVSDQAIRNLIEDAEAVS